MAEYARTEINAIGGYYAYGKELINGGSVYDFDVTKLCVYTQDIGLTGIEVYDLLRDEYDIQVEFGDIGNMMAYISIGDRIRDIERLVGALADIKRLYEKDGSGLIDCEYIQPEVVVSPQKAFMRNADRCPSKRRSSASAENSSCVIRRGFLSWRRESGSPGRSSTIFCLPGKRAVLSREQKILRWNT